MNRFNASALRSKLSSIQSRIRSANSRFQSDMRRAQSQLRAADRDCRRSVDDLRRALRTTSNQALIVTSYEWQFFTIRERTLPEREASAHGVVIQTDEDSE